MEVLLQLIQLNLGDCSSAAIWVARATATPLSRTKRLFDSMYSKGPRDQPENLLGGSGDQPRNPLGGSKDQLERPLPLGGPTMTREAHLEWLNACLIGSGTNTKFMPKLPKEDLRTPPESRPSRTSSFLLTNLHLHSMFIKISVTGVKNSCNESWRLILSFGAKSIPHDSYLQGLTPSYNTPINAHERQIISHNCYLWGPPTIPRHSHKCGLRRWRDFKASTSTCIVCMHQM